VQNYATAKAMWIAQPRREVVTKTPANHPYVGRRTPLLRSPDKTKSAQRSPQASVITNGSKLLPGIDQRSTWVRRCRDLIELHISDLGGESNISASERSLIRRASVLTVELERLEVKFALANAASAEDLDLYSRAASNLRRLLEAVGLRRRSRDITPPDPLDYAAEHST
jgi:hypothetical protein